MLSLSINKELLKHAAKMEKSLKAECERMKNENNKLKKLNSVNITFHREVMAKLDEDLQSMTAVRNDLQQKLRVSNFQKNLDREEYERLLQVANQCNVNCP